MVVYGRSKAGFSNGYRMRLWAYPNLTKSDQAKKILTKGYERQKFFLEAVLQDYSSSILYLDYILEGSLLPTMRQMIMEIKLTKFPSIPLFHSMDRIWDRM